MSRPNDADERATALINTIPQYLKYLEEELLAGLQGKKSNPVLMAEYESWYDEFYE